jgi:hypothetical protein
MLQLLIAEPDQRLKRDLVTEPIITAQFKNLCVDETLDQPEYVGVGAALDLAHQPLFVSRKSRERVGQGKPVGKELVGDIEGTPTDHVLIEVPTHPLGRVNTACVPVTVRKPGDRIHLSSPVPRKALTGRRTGRLVQQLIRRQVVDVL